MSRLNIANPIIFKDGTIRPEFRDYLYSIVDTVIDDALRKGNNLSDLDSIPSARTNLDVDQKGALTLDTVSTTGKVSRAMNDSGGADTAFVHNVDGTFSDRESIVHSFQINDSEVAGFKSDGSLNCWGITRNGIPNVFYWYEVSEKIIFTGETTWGATNNMTIRYNATDSRGEWFMPNTSSDDMLIGGQTADYTFGQHVAGDIEIKGMSAGAAATGTSVHGGNLSFIGGDATNNGDGGDVTIAGGAGNGTGSDGRVIFIPPTSSAGLPAGALWNNGGTPDIA